MDLNANLRDQEALLTMPELQSYQNDRLRELRAALREWLRGGGFEPRWADCPTATRYYAGRGAMASSSVGGR